MPTPLISVIVPLYNAAATVAQTLRSVRAQTLTNWECLIVDDGSTDDGPQVALRLIAGDRRCRILSQPNGGLAAARNTGLSHAAGRFVQLLDSDDWLAPTALERLASAADASPSGAVAGAWELHDSAGARLGRTIPAPAQPLNLDRLLDGNRIAPHSHLIRRDWFNADRFDTSLRVVEDLDLWLRLTERGLTWTPVEETVAHYRVRPGSLSKNPSLMFGTHRTVLTRAYERLAAAGSSVNHAPTRLARALRASGLFYATNAALVDTDPEKTVASDLLLHAGPNDDAARPSVSPSELGAAAAWSLLFGLGIGPATLESSAPNWARHLRDWWDRCASLGWTTAEGDELTTPALHALASEILDPGRIADALLDAAPAGAPIVLIGLGQNGREVARRAAIRGVAAETRDDRATGARPIDAPLPLGATVIVSPSDDAAILPRLRRAARIVRWSDQRSRLADALVFSIKPSFAAQAPSGSTTRRTPSRASR